MADTIIPDEEATKKEGKDTEEVSSQSNISSVKQQIFDEIDALLGEMPLAQIPAAYPHKDRKKNKSKVTVKTEFEHDVTTTSLEESFQKTEEMLDEAEQMLENDENLSKKEKEKQRRKQLSGHRNRMRILYDETHFRGWPEHHILEFLLFYVRDMSDTREVSRQLINTFGSIQNVFDAPMERLMEVDQIGIESARLITLIPKLTAVYLGNTTRVDTFVRDRRDAARLLLPHFVDATVEKTMILCADENHRFTGICDISVGGRYSTTFDIRTILEKAYAKQTVFLYLAHNHVNSSPQPSHDDWYATNEVVTTLFNAGVFVIDHLIYEKKNIVSMRELSKQSDRPLCWA